ncbi:2-octaprenyl-6-methoxyphenyl hydroxylase [Pseudoalteromonas xiamenensis]|uniref:2-octaprenyl-6-methoxyphenyl hydroxylase n=1 Tax=Pseudoalteromonas xiamenensis TaxID=882626 RepID=UPI0027E46EE9|nr:2-octaprenyl-6-methoxyphenyl hydroxylase [Pseudoalteromonas xiamenensis]WMN60911.1 2-octaprenyl-6-methoxyphenyl hydroxylase [Pseudoalteromonas xiamenensis]
MEKTSNFDVVIVGGGLAGATAALAIKKQSPQCCIAVVEANKPQSEYHPSFDDRSIALAAQSVEYLHELGIFSANTEYMAEIHDVAVSDRGHFGKTWINKDEYGVDALGIVVEVAPFGHQLHTQLLQNDITLFCPDTVEGIEPTLEFSQVTLNSGMELKTKLVVVADGANSPTRQLLKGEFDRVAYEQGALIANVGLAQPHQGKAFERFTQHGPMALLPMSRNRYSLVWCMPEEDLETFRTLPEEAFLHELQNAFGYRAGQFVQVGQRATYPLVLGRVNSLVQHRCVFLGNAAHAIHPIAGQGFNLGLRDIQVLAKLFTETSAAEWGDYRFTEAYKIARDPDIKKVMTLTDALVRLFSNESRVMALGRSLGLLSMTLSPSLKSPLAKQLMGKIAQGV